MKLKDFIVKIFFFYFCNPLYFNKKINKTKFIFKWHYLHFSIFNFSFVFSKNINIFLLYYTLYGVHRTMYSVHRTVYSEQCLPYSVHPFQLSAFLQGTADVILSDSPFNEYHARFTTVP